MAMAGDHAPSFVGHVADPSFAETDNELQILERSTPFSSGPTTRWSTRQPPPAPPTR